MSDRRNFRSSMTYTCKSPSLPLKLLVGKLDYLKTYGGPQVGATFSLWDINLHQADQLQYGEGNKSKYFNISTAKVYTTATAGKFHRVF